MYEISANDLSRAWQAGFSNITMANVNVLSCYQMIDIRISRFYAMIMSTVILRISLYSKSCTVAILMYDNRDCTYLFIIM